MRQEYDCFEVFKSKSDISTISGIAQLWSQDMVPILQQYTDHTGESVFVENCYADPDLPLCDNALHEAPNVEFSNCANEANMIEAAVLMRENRYEPINREGN